MVLRTKLFGSTDTLHAIMSKFEHFLWRDNNYNKKLFTEMLMEITYDFPNILGIITGCQTLYLIFKYKLNNCWIDNKLICLIYLILFYLGLDLYLGQLIKKPNESHT